jgi:hypothetical protein
VEPQPYSEVPVDRDGGAGRRTTRVAVTDAGRTALDALQDQATPHTRL